MPIQGVSGQQSYRMFQAEIKEGELVFPSKEAHDEAMRVGLFCIKTDLNFKVGKQFARTFVDNPKYTQMGEISPVDGYLTSKEAQTVRLTLDEKNWKKCHVNGKEAVGEANYPKEIRKLGRGLKVLSSTILESVMRQNHVPQELWFKATGGCTHNEGSYFLMFNNYSPKLGDRPYGLGAHKDWGHISILRARQPGLEVEIDGQFYPVEPGEKDEVIVNFGYCLEKLLPHITACTHRVLTQKIEERISIVLFADPCVGPYREGVQCEDKEGHVYYYNPESNQLENPLTVVDFFKEKTKELYG